MVLFVDHDILGVIRTGPTLHIREDVPVTHAFGIRPGPNGVLVESEGVIFGRHPAPARMIVGPLHRFQFLFDRQLLAGFEQQYLKAVRREDVSGHAAGRA